MRLLVTGANGMLGQDLCPEFEKAGYDVIKTDKDELDITDYSAVEEFFDRYKPELVIHCAAYTNVDKAEEDVDMATLINVNGTENIAKASSKINAVMVYISTDYVFDGTKKKPYLPDDIPNPINMYGKTKLEGELAVQEYCTKYYIARTSWLYGIHGKNFVETMISLKDKPELKVVDDQTGCPTWTMELVKGIMKILDKPYGIYHVCGLGSTSWYNFAKEIFKKEGLKVNLKPCTTQEFPRSATRPENSVMINNNNLILTRKWQDALADYLDLRKVNL